MQRSRSTSVKRAGYLFRGDDDEHEKEIWLCQYCRQRCQRNHGQPHRPWIWNQCVRGICCTGNWHHNSCKPWMFARDRGWMMQHISADIPSCLFSDKWASLLSVFLKPAIAARQGSTLAYIFTSTSTSTSTSVEVKFVGGMRMTPAWYACPSPHLPPVVGSHSKLPSQWSSWSMGDFTPWGTGFLHLDTKPCSLGTTQTITSSLSHVSSSCSCVAKSNKPRSSHIDLIVVRDRCTRTPAPGTRYSIFQGRRYHDGAWGDIAGIIVSSSLIDCIHPKCTCSYELVGIIQPRKII